MYSFLEKEFKVLDKGLIRVVDVMGDDDAIVDSARISYGKGTKTKNQNRGLIRYLMKHRHTSPFEMCEIKLHLKMPIFVARQWIRHRTASLNEYSARYSILEDDFYIPTLEDISKQSSINNQGRGDAIEEGQAKKIQADFEEASKKAYQTYQDMLDQGVARELARSILPTNIYTSLYWKIDLHNFLHFIALRADHHAQLEIRKYAEVMLDIVKEWVPLVYEAFMDYRVNSTPVSGIEKDLLQRKSDDLSSLGKTEKLEFEKNWPLTTSNKE